MSNKKLDLTLANKELNTIKESINNLKVKRNEAELSVDRIIKQEKERAKENSLRNCSTDLEKKLDEYECEFVQLKKEKISKLEHYSFENMKNGAVSFPFDNATQNTIKNIKKEANEVISERFIKVYFKMTGKRIVSEDDFLQVLEKLPKIRELFLKHKNNKINFLIESFVKRICNTKEDKKNEEYPVSMIVSISIIFILLSFVIFPIYITSLGVIFINNLIKTYSLKRSLDLLKLIEDNYSEMETTLEKYLYDEYKNKQSEIESEFSQPILLLQKEIDSISQDITSTRQETIANFKFDESDIIKNLEETLSGIDHSITDQYQLEKSVNNKINQIKKEINNLEAAYKNECDKLVKRYINFEGGGNLKLFPEEFLLDIQEPLKFFVKARFSYFFVYKQFVVVNDFIRLICLQLRSLMMPSAFQIQVWDITTAGSGLMPFLNPDPKGDNGEFIICNNTSSVKECLNSLNIILQKRFQVIRVSYDNINQYNNDMITLNSVTENYYIIFVLSPEILLNDENYIRLLVNGASLGIYIYTFGDVVKLNDAYFSIIENSNYCAVVQNGQVIPSSAGALMEQICNKNRK